MTTLIDKSDIFLLLDLSLNNNGLIWYGGCSYANIKKNTFRC